MIEVGDGPWWATAEGDVQVWLGDCLDVLCGMPENSVDAIVTDPPAGISFMAREWDDFRRARNPADAGRDDVFGRTSARGPEYGRRDRDRFIDWLTKRLTEALRVLKPGGHALVWSIPRTAGWTHRAIEDAGFEIRDGIPHLFGSGFPKSLNVSKAIDAEAGAEREAVGKRIHPATGRPLGGYRTDNDRAAYGDFSMCQDSRDITAPATPEAARWDGFGTALKPGQEIWWLARKPLAGTVAGNVLEWGTGALNIAACRVATADLLGGGASTKGSASHADGWDSPWKHDPDAVAAHAARAAENVAQAEALGRWPANVVFSHSAACESAGTRRVRGSRIDKPADVLPDDRSAYGSGLNGSRPARGIGDEDGLETVTAWVCADDCPAGQLDRQSGATVSPSRPVRQGGYHGGGFDVGKTEGTPRDSFGIGYGDSGGASRFYPVFRYQAKAPASERPRLEDGTAHETVKPLGLISWLIRLITPPGGLVLDMFAGSGPVAEAAVVEGFRAVLIEQNPKSADLIVKRLGKPIQPVLFGDGAA